MFGMWKTGLTGIGMTAALVLAGCASTGGSSGARPAAAGATSTQGVACSKCQVTYVQVPANNPKGRFVGYTSRKDMECPDCKTAVQNFFETGKLQHACTHCQGTMEVCDAHS